MVVYEFSQKTAQVVKRTWKSIQSFSYSQLIAPSMTNKVIEYKMLVLLLVEPIKFCHISIEGCLIM